MTTLPDDPAPELVELPTDPAPDEPKAPARRRPLAGLRPKAGAELDPIVVGDDLRPDAVPRPSSTSSAAKPKSNRGGARPGAGRKPAKVTESRELVVGMERFYSGLGATAAMATMAPGVPTAVRARLVAVSAVLVASVDDPDRGVVAGGASAQARAMVAELVKYSETNAAVRAALIRLTSGGALAAVLAAHLPLLLAIVNEPSPQHQAEAELAGGLADLLRPRPTDEPASS